MTSLPDAVAALLASPAEVGSAAQAFPFLTTDGQGWPHVALLSTRELRVVGDDGGMAAVLRRSTTTANLTRSGQATLVAVGGDVAHVVKLQVARTIEHDDLVGVVLTVESHKADTAGVALSPLSFVPTDELAIAEHWDRTAALLDELSRS